MRQQEDIEALIQFGRNLRKIREQKGISLRSLELVTSIDFSDLARIERGEINPTFITILSIAKGLDVAPSTLLIF